MRDFFETDGLEAIVAAELGFAKATFETELGCWVEFDVLINFVWVGKYQSTADVAEQSSLTGLMMKEAAFGVDRVVGLPSGD